MVCDDDDELSRQEGIVFDIKRFSVHDGPGIRTTVFVKGCNLNCWWCHNPESKRFKPELFLFTAKCRNCGKCVSVCPKHGHRIDDHGHTIDRSLCILCGKCVSNCVFDGLKIIGQSRTASDVLTEVLEDRDFYTKSNGGMTISGGEPMCQLDFTYALLKLAKVNHIHTAIETNGGSALSHYEKVFPEVDLFLFDLKQMDPEKHKKMTGASLEPVLSNLNWLAERGAKIILRCPVIPTANAEDDSHWSKVAQTAKKFSGIEGIEYLPYHRLWISKEQGLGSSVDEHRKEYLEIPRQRLDEIHRLLEQSGKLVCKG